ncbi:Fatty acid biosynthesis 1 [Hibiscus syriacus]|uniref:Fatty acid biosynthesis 1 n=1 Tax=Hibiscus syriacus TaxID=106335 RepID=A0A6A3AWD8_HIBSY|nr:zinc finger CCCH domain-containing protein 62-like [Hibiscus syriacus]KAE8708716.1 Fatty acid biosynthesis 1 [Hibiscus syriacus]
MAISDSDGRSSEDYNESFEEEDCSNNYGSDPDYHYGTDPSYSDEEDTNTKFQNLSIKEKSSFARDSDLNNEKTPELGIGFSPVDDKIYENVQNIIKDGRLEKLKVDECKIYLRKNGIRLSGKKDVLIQRIKEHLEVSNGGGEKKYPISSFVLNCKGDACTGDVVMFEQNVYEMFNLASRSASGPPCGTRIVAGRIVKESYGAAKQQHTFTIEVLWSKGEKPLPPLHPLLIKGRNLYRLKTLRQKWEDEGERQKVSMEKHSRGSLARSYREVRIQEKERRKILRSNRILKGEEKSKNPSKSQLCSTPLEVQPQQPSSSTNSGRVAPEHQRSSSTSNMEKLSVMTPQSGYLPETHRLATQPQFGYCPNVRNGSTRPECQNVHVRNTYQNQIPRNSCKRISIQKAQFQKVNKFYENNQPNFPVDRYWNCRYDKSTASGMNKLPETNYYRQQPRSTNRCNPPQRQDFRSQQLCRYHAQGRCHYGENCKFLHD